MGVEAAKDWRKFAAQCLSKFAMTNIEITDLFGAKLVHEEPYRLWQVRVRTSPEVAEKVITSSGKDAVFIRPQRPQDLALSDAYTIVWSKWNSEASAGELAAIWKIVENIPEHRGLARSSASIGARIPWKSIRTARQALIPHDDRFTVQRLGVQDSKTFEMIGVPIGAKAGEVARFCREIQWVAIPLRRTPQHDCVTWWLTAEQAPAEPGAKWGSATILISELDADQRVSQRPTDSKKGKQGQSNVEKQEETISSVGGQHARQGADKLIDADPWAGWKNSKTSSSSSSSKTSPPADLPADPRIAALTTRLSAIEGDHQKLSQKVETIDGKLGTISNNMAEQFQSVLAGIASLQSAQEEAAKRQKSS